MLLAVDIGNTNITMGVFDDDDLAAKWRIATDASRLADEYALMVNQLLPYKRAVARQGQCRGRLQRRPPLPPTFVELCRANFGVERSLSVRGQGLASGFYTTIPATSGPTA